MYLLQTFYVHVKSLDEHGCSPFWHDKMIGEIGLPKLASLVSLSRSSAWWRGSSRAFSEDNKNQEAAEMYYSTHVFVNPKIELWKVNVLLHEF